MRLLLGPVSDNSTQSGWIGPPVLDGSYCLDGDKKNEEAEGRDGMVDKSLERPELRRGLAMVERAESGEDA